MDKVLPLSNTDWIKRIFNPKCNRQKTTSDETLNDAIPHLQKEESKRDHLNYYGGVTSMGSGEILSIQIMHPCAGNGYHGSGDPGSGFGSENGQKLIYEVTTQEWINSDPVSHISFSMPDRDWCILESSDIWNQFLDYAGNLQNIENHEHLQDPV